jgi:hypothetical protein
VDGLHNREIIISNRNIIVTAFYEFAIIHCTMTEEEKAGVIAILAIDVQNCLQEYKEKLLWLVHGNHKDTPLPTVEETRLQMKQLKEKINSLLTDIETKTK